MNSLLESKKLNDIKPLASMIEYCRYKDQSTILVRL